MEILTELKARNIFYSNSSQGNVLINCPFHNDIHPSLSVSLSSGVFICFACKERGRFYRLIAEWDGISESEAEDKEKKGASVEDDLIAIEKAFTEEDKAHKPIKYLNWDSFKAKFPVVTDYPEAVSYLSSRKIKAAIERFNIRFGVSGGKYDKRVIIPIFHTNEKLISYVGRAIYRDIVPKTRKPRSASTTLFGLVDILWRLKFIRNARLSWVVIVEGEFDAIYLQLLGIPAVATMGTSGLNDNQISLLIKHCNRVIISYDNDDAGRIAIKGTLDKFGKIKKLGDVDKLKRYLPVETVTLPVGRDPNDLSPEEVNDLYGNYVLKGLHV